MFKVNNKDNLEYNFPRRASFLFSLLGTRNLSLDTRAKHGLFGISIIASCKRFKVRNRSKESK